MSLEEFRVVTTSGPSSSASEAGNARTAQAADLNATAAALRESEMKYRALFDLVDEGFCIVDRVRGDPPNFRYVTVNPGFERQTGLTDAIGRTMRELVPNIDEEVMDHYARVANGGAPEAFTAFGLDREFEVQALGTGHPGQIAVLFRDVTERRRAEEALLASEQRQAFLLRLSDALRPLKGPVEVQEVAARMLGEHLGVDRCAYGEIDEAGEVVTVHQDFHLHTLPSVAGRYRIQDYGKATLETIRGGGAFTVEDAQVDPRLANREVQRSYTAMDVRSAVVMPLIKAGRFVALLTLQKREPHAWTNPELQIIADVADRTWAAVEQALAEAALRESEGRLKLLLEELQHRVRNILGMIRSIVRLSGDEYEDVDEYSAHLSGRLDALARTQVLLTRAAGATVDLETLIRDELAAQIADHCCYSVEGPAIALSSKAAEVVGLALHELGTNSIKYGALAEARGHIDIRWSVASIGEDTWVQLVWQEHCHLGIIQPIRRGFGTELIEQRVPYELAGEAALYLTSHGVRAEIAFPLFDGTSVLETGPNRSVGG